MDLEKLISDFVANEVPSGVLVTLPTLEQSLGSMVRQRIKPEAAAFYCKSAKLSPVLAENYIKFCTWFKNGGMEKNQSEVEQPVEIIGRLIPTKDKETIISSYLDKIARTTSSTSFKEMQGIVERTQDIVDSLNFKDSAISDIYFKFFPEAKGSPTTDKMYAELSALAGAVHSVIARNR